MRALSVLLAAAAFTLLAPAPLSAQPTTPADPREAARVLTKQGSDRFKAGEYDKAIELFRQADKLYHAPTIVLREAQAHAKKGDLFAARDLYRSVISESIGRDAHKAFQEAKKEAKKEMLAVDARIPRVQIILYGATARAQASIDGKVVPLDTPVEQRPGPHTLIVSDGDRSMIRKLTLAERERIKVEFEMPTAATPPPKQPPEPPEPAPTKTTPTTETLPKPAPPPPPPPPPAETSSSRGIPDPDPTPPEPAPDARSGGMPTTAMIAFGVGAMCFGGGVVGGGLWISEDTSHGAATTGAIAIIGLSLAGFGAGLGAILWAADSAPTTVTVSVGPGSVGVRGTF